MRDEGDDWTAPTHPIIIREQWQRPTKSSMWVTITPMAVRSTHWTAGQHQFTWLQWTWSTDTAGHTWTGQWRLQSTSYPVWIHSGQDQQEERLHLFNCCQAKTQTRLSVSWKCGWNCTYARQVNGQRKWFSASSGRCVLRLNHYIHYYALCNITVLCYLVYVTHKKVKMV